MRSNDGVMTSRKRVLAAIRGLPVDRVPVMYWLNPHTTCRLLSEYRPGVNKTANFLARLLWGRFRRGGELDAGQWTRGLPLLFEEYGNQEYALELGADVAILSPALSSPTHMLRTLRRRNGRLSFVGPLGSLHGLGGIYADVIQPAVKSISDLAGYQLPPLREAHFAGIRRFRSRYPQACALVEVMSFQQALSDFIWRSDQFMLALYDYPEEVHAFLKRLADWVEVIIRMAIQAGADMVFLQDDYGSSGRPLISPKMWGTITYPHLKRFIDVAHEAGVPFMLHSCGYQTPFLEAYMEAGLDVLQSFQPKAGNDFKAAFEKYGDRLAFATGIDVQQGEWMRPQELRESILRSYQIGRRTGRHILGMTHMMQYTMPMGNARTIFDTVREIQDKGENDACDP